MSKQISTDFSSSNSFSFESDPRMLGKTFGYESTYFDLGGGGGGKGGRYDDEQSGSGSDDENSSSSSYILGKNWRDLIPVIKVDMRLLLHLMTSGVRFNRINFAP